jgi:predicted DCC family thiol-disulfide oxidoreductase YuxK
MNSSAQPITNEDTPAARAAKPVVVYDGECQFCLNQVAKLKRLDRNDRFEFVPRQAEGLDDRFPQLAEGDFNTGMRLVMSDGRIHVGPDAAYEIAKRIPRYRIPARLYLVPGLHWGFQKAYNWVAQNRYRLAGKCDSNTCKI